jgi:hypothetical protein
MNERMNGMNYYTSQCQKIKRVNDKHNNGTCFTTLTQEKIKLIVLVSSDASGTSEIRVCPFPPVLKIAIKYQNILIICMVLLLKSSNSHVGCWYRVDESPNDTVIFELV